MTFRRCDIWVTMTYRLKFVELRRNSSNFSRIRIGTNFWFCFIFLLPPIEERSFAGLSLLWAWSMQIVSSLTHKNIIHRCYPVFTFAILGSPIRFNASLRSWHFLFLSVQYIYPLKDIFLPRLLLVKNWHFLFLSLYISS